MDQAEHKEILRVINQVTYLFKFRISWVLCWKCGCITCFEDLACCCVAELPLFCWVQVVMVGSVGVLGAWLLLGFGSVCCIIGFDLFLKKFSFQYSVLTCCCTLPWWPLHLGAGFSGVARSLLGVGALWGCACTGTGVVRMLSVTWSCVTLAS